MINVKIDSARHVLILTADNEGRSALKDCYTATNGGYWRAESEVAQALHEAYEFVRPEDVPGALTDAPILVDCDYIGRPDSGDVIIMDGAAVYWFPDYMVIDPWEELKNKGRVEFVEGRPFADQTPRPAPKSREFIESHFTGGEREGVAIWIGQHSFPESMSYQDVGAAWPEFHRYPGDDAWDEGLYFWRDGTRYGPFNGAVTGCESVEKLGGRFEPPHAADPRQLVFEFVAEVEAA